MSTTFVENSEVDMLDRSRSEAVPLLLGAYESANPIAPLSTTSPDIDLEDADEIQRRFFDYLDQPVQRVTGGEAAPSISKVLERAAIAKTEKAVVEYNSEVSGVIGRLVLAEGKSGEIGAPIVVLLAAGETEADIDAALGQEASSVAAPATAPAPAELDVAVAPAASAATESAAPPANSAVAPQEVVSDYAGTRVFASPLARKLARERGLDVATLRGTGPGGRIVRRDVENAPTVTAPAAATAVAAVPAPAVPHFYLTTKCKVDALLALREQINAHSPVRVSVNDPVVKAVALAFAEVPEANVTWTDTATLRHSSVDISVAVSTEGGLVTPVLRSAEAKTITEPSTGHLLLSGWRRSPSALKTLSVFFCSPVTLRAESAS